MTSDEEEQTNRVRNQGRENGLFRKCMDTIKSSHTIGQGLRTAALAAGLMTDRNCYAELLCQFYIATAALENRMEELRNSSKLVRDVGALGYSFTVDYEKDLHALLGNNWRVIVTKWETLGASDYRTKLKTCGELEVVAAAFILWGPLIIGGGAALKPRVRKSFGEDACNIFSSVIGTAGGGRQKRRKHFIDVFDTLLPITENTQQRTTTIVNACTDFMTLNNYMMMSVQQQPWWKKWIVAGLVVSTSVLIWKFFYSDHDHPSSASDVKK